MLLSNWQVFWLNPQLMAFPFLNSGKENKLFMTSCAEVGFTATGIAPDLHRTSHFNSLREAEKPITAQN